MFTSSGLAHSKVKKIYFNAIDSSHLANIEILSCIVKFFYCFVVEVAQFIII